MSDWEGFCVNYILNLNILETEIGRCRGFALEIAKSEWMTSILPNGAKIFHIQIHLGSAVLFQNNFGFQSSFVIFFLAIE